jgi:uncharacterized glyoxalase superfamily protein PhnB
MRVNRSIPEATVIPVLTYPSVPDAVEWLGAAFGFVERVRIGEGHRAQLAMGDGAVSIADSGGNRRPPDASAITHSVMIRVADAQSMCDAAAREGAKVVTAMTDFPYGERQCSVQDPWGHLWTFSQTIADVAPEEWGGETRASA